MSRKNPRPTFGVSNSTRLFAALAFFLIVATMFHLSALGQNSAKVTEDLPSGPMQAKATTSCTECHEARIIVQQRLSKAAWSKEVDKMVKWGALVDPGDHDALVDYLSANFNADQPAYIPPRSASDKAEKQVMRKTPQPPSAH